MTYWEQRQQQLNKQLEKDEEKLKVKLSKRYDTEQKRLEKEIAAYYQAYGENNVIEYRKLMERLPDEDKRLLIERMDNFAQKYPEHAHLMPVRESIYKLNRLEGLQTSIKIQQLEIGAIDNEELQNHLEKLALRSANASAKEMGFGKNFYTVDSDLLAKTVNAEWADGKSFSERIWNNREKLANYLNSDFATAVVRGDSYEKCINALTARFSKVSRSDMYRLIYTEGTFVQNEASIAPFEEDFEEYEISIADERACQICKALQNKKFRIKDRRAGVNFPPFHAWCRCSFTIAVTDWDRWMDDYVKNKSGNAVANSGESGIIETERMKSSSDYAVPKDLTNSREFRSKFDLMDTNPEIQREYYQVAKDMLSHRSGNNGEDLAYFNTRTHKWYKSTTGTEKGTPDYTEEILSGLKKSQRGEIVSFHNHPEGMPPSDADLNAALANGYKKGYTIGHNGVIFEYTPPKQKIPESAYMLYVENFKKQGLSEFEAQLSALNRLKELYGFDFREVK